MVSHELPDFRDKGKRANEKETKLDIRENRWSTYVEHH